MNTSDFNTAKSLREIHNKNKATKEKQQFKDRLQKITEKKDADYNDWFALLF